MRYFLYYGSVDVPLGCPLLNSHSLAEMIDVKNLDAPAKFSTDREQDLRSHFVASVLDGKQMILAETRDKLTLLMLMYSTHQAASLRSLMSYFSICSMG